MTLGGLAKAGVMNNNNKIRGHVGKVTRDASVAREGTR